MDKKTKLKIFSGSVCTILGCSIGYTLYSLYKAVKITEAYEAHYNRDEKVFGDNEAKRKYITLGTIGKKGGKN